MFKSEIPDYLSNQIAHRLYFYSKSKLVAVSLPLVCFMGIIVILPGLLALYWAWKYSAARAFIDVYLPVLLLLPEYYRWILPALPDPTFSQAAVLPITAVFLPSALRIWKFSLMDFLIFGFAMSVAVSEFENAGFKEAQNLMFDMVASVVLPYVLAKGLIEPNGLRVAFARRFVILIFAVSVISLYEFRFGRTPWQIFLNPFFPGQADGWITTFRYGFARVAGPYGHAILCGLILVIGYRIQRWLEWSNNWAPRFKFLPWLNVSKARLITIGILVGIAMTLVRGPWLGAFAGAIVAGIGRAQNRKRALLVVAASVVLVGIPAAAWFYSYASVGRLGAKTASQESAAYRKELLDKYVDVALRKSALGWGRNTWPKVPGMPSIDNYYLLLALMHGFVADGFLLAIIFGMFVRLIRFEMRKQAPPSRNSLGFTLAAIYLGIAVTIATVYMGLTVTPIFAVLTGWSEGYLLNRHQTGTDAEHSKQLRSLRFGFRRVVA